MVLRLYGVYFIVKKVSMSNLMGQEIKLSCLARHPINLTYIRFKLHTMRCIKTYYEKIDFCIHLLWCFNKAKLIARAYVVNFPQVTTSDKYSAGAFMITCLLNFMMSCILFKF